MNCDGVASVTVNDDMKVRFSSMMKSLDYVVLLIIGCAGSLAFIVLYNLTNINVGERVREIATLKVLGFRAGETNAYIFRETLILSIIGCILGLGLGLVLYQYVVKTVEVDILMLGRSVSLDVYKRQVLLSSVDEGVFRKLGVNLTCEPKYETNKLYQKN